MVYEELSNPVAATTIVWKPFFGAPTGIYELLVAFPAAMAAIVAVSFATRRTRAWRFLVR